MLHKFGQLKYLRDSFVFTMITKTWSWGTYANPYTKPIYNDIGIPRPKNHDIEIPRPKNHHIKIQGLKNHDIEKRRQINHNIVIPRRLFRGQKATVSRFQD